MRGYLLVVLGVSLAVVGGATGLWWLDCLSMAVACLGAVVIEAAHGEALNELARRRNVDGRAS